MKKLWFVAALFSAVCLTAVAPLAHAKGTGEDVFIDEGEGDFDSTSTTAQSTPKMHKETAKALPQKRQPSSEDTQPQVMDDSAAQHPVATVAEEKAAPPTASSTDPLPFEDKAAGPTADDQALKQDEAQPEVMHEAPPAPPPVAEEKTPAPHKTHVAKAAAKQVSKFAGGGYVHTTKECPMMREPASDSEAVSHTHVDRKIWVEEVDAHWVKGFNRAGEPVYINRSCVKK
jgi:hypothetical protein